jgi:hypothetical protein
MPCGTNYLGQSCETKIELYIVPQWYKWYENLFAIKNLMEKNVQHCVCSLMGAGIEPSS